MDNAAVIERILEWGYLPAVENDIRSFVVHHEKGEVITYSQAEMIHAYRAWEIATGVYRTGERLVTIEDFLIIGSRVPVRRAILLMTEHNYSGYDLVEIVDNDIDLSLMNSLRDGVDS